jgi:hypothetical protein
MLPSEISSDGQAIAAIAHGDLGHETQVAGDELRRGLGIAMFLIALGEHIFLLGGQHRKFLDFGQIAVERLLPAQGGTSPGRCCLLLMILISLAGAAFRGPTTWVEAVFCYT